MPMRTVAIAGVGLIGASFGLALKKAGFQGRIVGVSSAPALEAAFQRNAIDEAASLEEAAARADLIYLSQPIARILKTIRKLDSYVRPGALITDAGSTKYAIVTEARRSIRNAQFLGGHPMAGKETRGAAEAEPDLFAGRTYIITPSSHTELETAAAQEFLAWAEKIGASLMVMDPEEHDRVVAYTSHLPQMISTALASLLSERFGVGDKLRATGPGLLDTTRLAMSSFEIWADILCTNSESIDDALSSCIGKLEELRSFLGSPRMKAEFVKAAALAHRLRGTN